MSKVDSAPRGSLSRWMERLGFLVTFLILIVFTIEVGVRVVGFIRPQVLGKLQPDLKEIFEQAPMEAHPYMAYAGKPGYHSPEGAPKQKSHNEWGFRGPSVTLKKPAGVYRIVCLGGSSTYGHGPSSDANTWPGRLQHYLNDPNLAKHGLKVEVLNGGLSGWSTFESTANLAFRMISFEPDLVIVYHTINDMRCALYDPPLPPEKRRFLAPTIDNRHWRDTWPRVVQPPGEALLEHSMTYLVMRSLFTNYTAGVDALNTWAIVDYDPKAKDLYLRDHIPDTGFDSFARNLRSIHAIAAANGAQVIFASQANDDGDIKAGSAQAQLAAMRRMTDIIEEVADETGAIYVDAKSKLEAKAHEIGMKKIFTAEVHLTDMGADQLALIFAHEILLGGHGLLDR